MEIEIKEIKLDFIFKKVYNESMNDTYHHFVRENEKKYYGESKDSIESNSMMNSEALRKLTSSSHHFKIDSISYFLEDGKIRDLKLELEEY